MFNFHFSFKGKLYLVITLTLIGFVTLSALAFHALNTLDTASNRVDELNQKTHLLQRLELDVLKLEQNKSSQQLKGLIPKYNSSLEQVTLHFSENQQQATNLSDRNVKSLINHIHGIQETLKVWVDSRMLWLENDRLLGYDSHSGLQKDIQQQFQQLEEKAFSNIRHSLSELKQSYGRFIEQRDQSQWDNLQQAFQGFEQQVEALGFNDIYGGHLKQVQTLLAQLKHTVFAMNQQDQVIQSAYQTLASEIADSNKILEQYLIRAQKEASLASEQAQNRIQGVCLTVGLLIVVMLIQISRHIIQGLNNISNVLNKLAKGDLTQRLPVNSQHKNELDQVNLSVNKMSQSLNQLLTEVSKSSLTLNAGANTLHCNLATMVSHTQQTHEQTESVASATEEISSTIQNMVAATGAAQHQTQQTQIAAEQGGGVITSAISSLGKLATTFDTLNQQVSELEIASRKVDGVTLMINNLAEQTNLLALNAAIEAARAGEAGRGFSVVADEVRSLAEKTVQATQDITGIIEVMQRSIQSLLHTMEEGSRYVDDGRKLGNKAAKAVEEIKERVLNANQYNQTLTENANEVAKATQIIAENMDQVAHNVSRNKQQSQEIQEYVKDTGAKTGHLLKMTERFQCEPHVN